MYARRMQAAQAVQLRRDVQCPGASKRQAAAQTPGDDCEPPRTQAKKYAHAMHIGGADADVAGAPDAASHLFDAPYNRESIDCFWRVAPVRRAWRALFGAPKRVVF